MRTITREEVKKHLENGDNIILLEALTQQYFDEGHLPGAIQIHPKQLEELAPQMLQDKEQLIVTYCGYAACPNSKMAAEGLTKLGYKNVAAYVGGKQDWEEAGLPLEKAACGAKDKGGCGCG